MLRAFENGTEEVQHLSRDCCELILECRCCKSMFRRAKYFHKHKLSVCRAYHRPVAPTYEEVLRFQREVASSWDSQQPSTSSEQVHEYKECNRIVEFVQNESGFVDPNEGLEELCGETRTNSPEPGELLVYPGSSASTSEGLSKFEPTSLVWY
ncbi:hypothetical protein KIN20_029709 [Parelaphostrongylus tenuis]|uniref:Uncharacterized protein n=1 Tax=Parelaphostrongylus tenuis TaxID=148309 RepID=A0AAD5WFP4_PARTN|nr:hypothetical protein KIN20_029709 [Parelaphostrongylus tenuis]